MARIVVYAPHIEGAATALRRAFQQIRLLEAIFSDYLDDSELNQFCRRAGGPPVAVSPNLFSILSQSQALAVASNGAFDITARPIIMLWRHARKVRALPDDESIARARLLTGYQHLILNAVNGTARLTLKGMSLDLGGIAKGYAADAAITTLQDSGIEAALVVLGGDIAMSGSPPHQEGWVIGVATPTLENRSQVKPLLLKNSAVSTSGDAEQFVEIDGIRYSHIIDPRTGRALTGQRSVSVVANKATRSDQLATAVSVMGLRDGLKLIAGEQSAALLFAENSTARTGIWKSKAWQRFETTTRSGVVD